MISKKWALARETDQAACYRVFGDVYSAHSYAHVWMSAFYGELEVCYRSLEVMTVIADCLWIRVNPLPKGRFAEDHA